MQNEILTLLEKLVRIDSIKSKPENLQAVVQVVEDYFQKMNLTVKRFESNGKPSIVITSQETKSPKLFLNGHLDIVEAEPDQFQLKVEGDKIMARGVFDMKGYIAVMMVAIKQALTRNHDLNLGVMFTTDEEIGGTNGVQYLLEKENYRCSIAYIPDGGTDFQLVTDQKGLLHVKFTSKGHAAHGARPWRGDNAIEKLIQIFLKIKDKYPQPHDENDWRVSVNLGKLLGGEATNKVPDHAEMHLDFRFPHPYTPQSLFAEVKTLINDPQIEAEFLISGDVVHSELNDQCFQTFMQSAEAKLGKPVHTEKAAGASDARFFAKQGIPVIMTRGNGGGQHAPEEWASVSDYVKSTEILIEFINQTC